MCVYMCIPKAVCLCLCVLGCGCRVSCMFMCTCVRMCWGRVVLVRQSCGVLMAPLAAAMLVGTPSLWTVGLFTRPPHWASHFPGRKRGWDVCPRRGNSRAHTAVSSAHPRSHLYTCVYRHGQGPRAHTSTPMNRCVHMCASMHVYTYLCSLPHAHTHAHTKYTCACRHPPSIYTHVCLWCLEGGHIPVAVGLS